MTDNVRPIAGFCFWVGAGMTDNTLDAAIKAAHTEAAQTSTNDWHEYDVLYARALIAKLLEGMERPDWFGVDEDCGWDAALTEIRRRAGLEDKA